MKCMAAHVVLISWRCSAVQACTCHHADPALATAEDKDYILSGMGNSGEEMCWQGQMGSVSSATQKRLGVC